MVNMMLPGTHCKQMNRYFQTPDICHQIFVPTHTLAAMNSKHTFSELTAVIDSLQMQRLATANHVSNTFISVIIEPTIIALQAEYETMYHLLAAVAKDDIDIKRILQNQIHEPELHLVYYLQVAGMLYLVLVAGLIIWVKWSLTSFLLRYQIKAHQKKKGILMTPLINQDEYKDHFQPSSYQEWKESITPAAMKRTPPLEKII